MKHLLIIRLSAMGDVAMTVPVIESLRKAYPELKITVLTRSRFTKLFCDVEGIDFMDFDPKGRHKGARGLLRLRKQIGELEVDAIADLHNVLRTKLLRLSFLPWQYSVAVIDKGRMEKQMLTRKYRKVVMQLKPTVERYRDVFHKLGLDVPVPCIPNHHQSDLPVEVADRIGRKQGIWVGVAPFAGHKGKIYPIPLVDELIGILSSKYERVFIFGGGKYEAEFATAMESRHVKVCSMIGKVGVDAEMNLISLLDVMVTMDSSSLHMASLMNIPAVSLWGATHPYAGFYGFGQNPDDAVQIDMPCRPCSVYGNKPCIFGTYDCMNRISAQMVADRVEQVLVRTGKIKA